jgi:transposase-like protein
MTTYSKEFKENIIARMLPPNSESLSKLSRETGIHEQTLRNWKAKARKSGKAAPGSDKSSDEWSSQDKFLIVVETAGMNEVELSEYCRTKGLYVEQVKGWKDICIQANGGVAQEASRLNKELKIKDKEVKALEKELQRKEKALAETAALLVLRKKLNALLGTDEEDE